MDFISGMVLVVFILTYVAISSEKVNRTATSLLGMGVVGVILVASGSGTFSTIVEHVEWHTVLFVTSMMIIVTVAAGSGMFQYIALELTKPTRGDSKKLFITFLVFVFGISLFFDTVSTILVVAPLTIEICKAMDLDFRPFLISEAITCNFASIPTIVGAVPNLVIAERTANVATLDQGFMFIVMMPLSIGLFMISLPIMLRYFKSMLVPVEDELVEQMLWIDPTQMIHSRKDFYASVIAMVILIVGFTMGHSFGFQPSLIAIIVASILLLITREWVDDILKRVNWGTVFFLVGLFGLVAALEITGIIDELAVFVGGLIEGSRELGIIFMIWVPGLLSAVIDNIPISAVLAPIAVQYASLSPLLPLALMFAVNIGGFVLPIGSPANILVLAMSEKEHKPIRLADFARLATPLGFMMLGIGTGWFLLLTLFIG